MRIAVIGTGHVGGALGTGWARAGHDVTYGTRDPKDADVQALLSKASGKAKAGPVVESISNAEVCAIAVPWAAVPDVLQEISGKLAGKTLIDCTNPSRDWLTANPSGSAGEQVARLAPGAKVVKSFNTTGFENMENPIFGKIAATMFYAGDDASAKKIVHQLSADLGFDPVDAGGLPMARALESLASLWGGLAYAQKMGRGIAFHLLRR